jgi:hypothetical protein
LKLAHDTCRSHMGVKNNKGLIMLNFFWPTLARDVKLYVASCKTCASRRRCTWFDNVPIAPIPRDQRSFNHWFVDVLGPLVANQKIDYNYCFVTKNSNTRFPVAYPLCTVTAKNICKYLLKLWSKFGISSFVSLDNATCITSHLTKFLMDKLG